MMTSPSTVLAPLDLLGGLLLEDGRTWGEAATADQWADAEAFLVPGDGPRRHWLGRARGYSKTTDVGAFVLVVLLTQMLPGQMAYAAAADQDQARLLLDSLRGFVRRDEVLSALVNVQAFRVQVPSKDTTLEILAADSAGSYGLRPAVLVLDELCQWPGTAGARELYNALSTALPKVPGSRSVVITTAGDPAHWSKRIFDAAGLSAAWRVSELHGPAPWQDPAEVEQQRDELLPSVFARLFENRWSAAEDRLVSQADLDACVVLAGDLPGVAGVEYHAGLDIGTSNDATVIVVAHAERELNATGGEVGTVIVVDHIRSWTGSREANVDLTAVEGHIAALAVEYQGLRVNYDPSQGIGMSQRLESQGVRMDRFNFTVSSVGTIASSLFNLLRTRSFKLPNHPVLHDELLNVRLKTTSAGVVRVDHDSGRHDDHVIALGLAALQLQDKPVSSFNTFMNALTSVKYEPVDVSASVALGSSAGAWSCKRCGNFNSQPVSLCNRCRIAR